LVSEKAVAGVKSFAGVVTRLRLEPGHHLQGFACLQISLACGREVGIELCRGRDFLGKFRRCAKLLDERIDPRMQPRERIARQRESVSINEPRNVQDR
jgi:hypothetical protein